MVKRILFFCSFVILLSPAYSDTLGTLALKGPLLEMEEVSWLQSPEGTPGARERLSGRKLLFDDKGRLLEEYWSGPSGTWNTRIIFQYDSAGNLIRKTFSQSPNLVPDVTEYRRDEQGLLLEQVHTFTVGTYGWTYRFSYDPEGTLLEKRKFDVSGRPESIIRYTCDEAGRISEEVLLTPREQILSVVRYRYESGIVIRELLPDGISVTSVRTWVHNGQGDPVMEWAHLPGGEILASKTFSYTYDGYENWTERRERTGGGQPVTVTERTLYYNELYKQAGEVVEER